MNAWLEFELNILNFIQNTIACPWMDRAMVAVTSLANAGIIWIVAALVLLFFPRWRRYGVMVLIALAASAVVGLVLIKPIVARPRPFLSVDFFELLIQTPQDFSFPSGHTMTSVAAAAVLWRADRRFGVAALALAALIAFSRMYLYVHFLTDILAGALLGAFIGAAVAWCGERILSRRAAKRKRGL